MKFYQLLKLTFKNKYEYIFPVVFDLEEKNKYTYFDQIRNLLEINNAQPIEVTQIKPYNESDIKNDLNQFDNLSNAVISITYIRTDDQGDKIIEHVYNRLIRIFAIEHEETGFGISAGKNYSLIVKLCNYEKLTGE